MYACSTKSMIAMGAVPRLEFGDGYFACFGNAVGERRRNRGAGTRLSLCEQTPRPATEPCCPACLRIGNPGPDRQGRALLGEDRLAHLATLSGGRTCGPAPTAPIAGASREGESRLAKDAGRGDEARTAGLRGTPSDLDRSTAGQILGGKDRHCCERGYSAPWSGPVRLRLPPPDLDGPPQSRGASRLLPKKEGVEALLSAGAQAPLHLPEPSEEPFSLAPVRHEVVEPADREAVDWVCGVLLAGQADLYSQDEADLALLPSLTRTWMLRGEQLKVKAPGTNEKRSVSASIDLAEGAIVWRTDEKRNADQFCATMSECAQRSSARGRLAVFLTDNAPGHKVGKTGIVRRALDNLVGRVVLVFLPTYSPHLQPAERLWRQWRPNVTHNHTRGNIADLKGDSDAWLGRMASDPEAVLRALGNKIIAQPIVLVA